MKSGKKWCIIYRDTLCEDILQGKLVIELYLKSLEIQGFKSFPEKTRLTFEKPITGIVGPNGSGKSNISDAILWVMGEQSTRVLRGGKMEDVIFGGTQRRTQVGFAEVSLILDNSDGRLGLDNTEVMITRRYYRSGESEYYINRSLVRLKDVNELLMDTGLGREGYSVIGQGRIDEVLSTKSKDRREIFEEAAGISRYRHRKEESERKLSQTDENLLRIGDKISELELQVEPLREQAETAKKYLLFRDELRGLEISMWLRDLDSLRVKADKADADHATAKQALDTVSGELEAVFAESESASDNMHRCDVEADSLRESLSSAEARQNSFDSAAAVLRSQFEGNTEQIERLNQEIQAQDSRQDGVGSKIASREVRLAEIADEKKSLDNRADALLSEQRGISESAGKSSSELSDLLKTESDFQGELQEKKSGLSALASQAQELFDRENSIRRDIASATDAYAEKSAEYDRLSAELIKTREETASLGNVVSGLAIKAQNRAKKAEMSTEKLNRITHEIKTLESRKNLLAEMEKDFRGYSRAVKIIMQESSRGTLRNIHGTAASLIRTGDRYAAAIETALGGAVQHIIVDTEEDGKSAIGYLKRHDGGRATFLPLSTIKGNILDEREVGGDDGFEGVAINLVEFDEKYSNVYANLLGRVIIADDLNSAVRIAKKHGYRYRTVTLDGQVVNAGGSMTGGSAASNVGVLSRANELEQLTSRIGDYSANLEEAKRELTESVRVKNAAEYELEIANGELRVAQDKLIRQESGTNHCMLLVQAAKDAVASLEGELDTINERIKLNSDETDSTRASITQIEAKTESLRSRVEEALQGQEQLSQERERVNALLSELRAEAASLDAEKDAIAKAVMELSAMRDEMSGSRERQIETIDNLKNRNDAIRAEILEKKRASNAVENEIESLKKQLSDINTKKLDIESERGKLNKKIQEKNQELLNLERESARLEQKKLAAQMEEKQIVDKLWDTYELSRSAAAKAGAVIESFSEAQKRINELKRQISTLGNPNIGAIEEFERVNSRYTFLSTQRDDVEKAKNELISIIDDITAHMCEIFTREFAVINESFEKTFKELFGGGHASLLLEDPSDVLECGIEIQVQPPGKSLKTLTLLSGGEKAFVAIAIYFAILTVRPPPFVVMDEIEAALDDANVMRFAEHMRRMSNNSQMLVITHRRATMEEADILYGVTMQELGISSILRVDLDEAEKQLGG